MPKMTTEPIKLIFCIVDRGKGELITKLCAEERITFNLLLHGRGTADSQMLNLLGLGETEKDIVMLSTANSKQPHIMRRLNEILHLSEPGKGIAFSVPFSSLASQYDSLAAFAGKDIRKEEEYGL